jgi:hypothetical protein
MTLRGLLVRALPLAAALTGTLAVWGEAQGVCDGYGRPRVRDVSVLPTSAQLGVGEVVQVSATAYATDGGLCSNGFFFTSSNVNVARVDSRGTITALSPGVAIITAFFGVVGAEGHSARIIILVRPPRGVMPQSGNPPTFERPPGVLPPLPGQRPRDLPAMPQFVVIRLSVEPVHPANDSAWLKQGALVVDRLDQTARRLMELFRNAAGVPIAGATSPAFLSGRERFRWDVCRRFTSALVSHAVAARELAAMPLRQVDGAAASQAARSLAQALSATDALDECEWLSQLIASPDSVPDWGAAYTSAATRFYAGWYSDVLHVHEAARSLALAMRPLLPPGRPFDVPPTLPPTPPTVGKQ